MNPPKFLIAISEKIVFIEFPATGKIIYTDLFNIRKVNFIIIGRFFSNEELAMFFGAF